MVPTLSLSGKDNFLLKTLEKETIHRQSWPANVQDLKKKYDFYTFLEEQLKNM